MNREKYQTMIRGLFATIMEKELVLGEDHVKEDILNLLDLLEDLEQFWNSDLELYENAEHLHQFIYTTRKKYLLGR